MNNQGRLPPGWRLVFVAFVSLGAAACSVSLPLPEGGNITCTTTSDCPDGLECSAALGTCVRATGGLPPTIVDSKVTPAAARRGVSVRASFTSSAPLARTPTLRLDSGQQMRGVDVEAGYDYTFELLADEAPEGTHTVLADLVDTAGVAAVGVPVGTVTVDFTPPSLAGGVIIASPTVAAGQTAALRVVVNEPLAGAPQLSLTWGLETIVVTDPVVVDAVTYDFDYVPDGGEPTTAAGLTVQMSDLAGNEAVQTESNVILFDSIGPGVIESVTRMSLVPGPLSPLSRVSGVTSGTRVQLLIAFDEPVVDDGATHYPRAVATSGNVFAETSHAGTTYVLDLDFGSQSPPADGAYDIDVTARDAVGNVRTTRLSSLRPNPSSFADRLSFRVDTSAPAPPLVADPLHIVQVRKPWGTDDTDGTSSSRLIGAPDSVEPCGTDAVCPTIVVYTGSDPATAAELTRITVSADGSFDREISQADYPALWVATIDSSGNQSDAGTVAHRVTNGQWHATFGGKATGDLVTNPHYVVSTPSGHIGLDTEPRLAFELPDYAGTARIGGAASSAAATAAWRSVGGQVSPTFIAVYGSAMAYDAGHEQVVLFGGTRASGCCSATTYDTTYLLGTQGWSTPTVGLHPEQREYHRMAYDSRRGRVVLYGGQDNFDSLSVYSYNDTWEWDGTRWEQRCDGSPPADVCSQNPGLRTQFGMTYDGDRRAVLLIGGGGDANTWAWDGTDWSIVPSQGQPPTGGDLGLAYDAAAGHTVLATSASSETWVLTLAGWENRGAAGAGGAGGGALAYDPVRGVVVLAVDNQVREWNGTSWTTIDNSAGPNKQNTGDGSIVFNGPRSRIMVFGGPPDTLWNYPQSSEFWEWNGAVFATPPFNNARPLDTTTAFYGGAAIAYAEVDKTLIALTGAAGTESWVWDGSRWALVASPTTPGVSGNQIKNQALAYSRALDQVILYGGAGGNETWSWGAWGSGVCGASLPRCWKQLAAGPSVRMGAQMSYDRRRKKVVLFGGRNPAGPNNTTSFYGETWEYGDWGQLGATDIRWQLVSSSGPTGRFDGAMAYDELRGVTVLYAGTRKWGSSNTGQGCEAGSTGPNDCNDTWLWDGHTWTQAAGTQPGYRRGHSMAYDTQLGRVVLYGGTQSPVAFSGPPPDFHDLWSFNGSDWELLPPDGNGDNEIEGKTNLAYDRARHVLLTTTPDPHDADASPQLLMWSWASNGGRPGIMVVFDAARTSVAAADFVGGSLLLSAQSRGGVPQLVDVAAGGYSVTAWDGGAATWVSIGSAPDNAAPLVTTDLDAALARRMRGFDGAMRFRVEAPYPAASNASGSLDLDYAELRIDYQIGAVEACGNAIVDRGEACDDGDTVDSGNGCSASCTRSGTCGDGALQAHFETCDNGGGNSNVAANACRTDCRPAHCGDGVVDSGEQCDDGNSLDDGNGCSATCQNNATCGDGVVEQGEGCDDGNAPAVDRGCLANCQRDACCSDVSGASCGGGSPTISNCVCAVDSYCCNSNWDFICVGEVETLNCGVCVW